MLEGDDTVMAASKPPSHLIPMPTNSFLVLLVSLLALQIIPGFMPVSDKSFFSSLMISLVLMAALYLVAYTRRELVIGLLLGIPTLGTTWALSFSTEMFLLYLHFTLAALFLSYIILHIFRYLFETHDVSLDMLFAAVCLYLLIGMAWAMIYTLIELLQPGSFNVSVDATAPYTLLTDLLYFSYVTLATLGYGDIVPLTRLSRAWASVEAVVGQFYLAFVVARLVSLQIMSEKKH